MLSDDVVRHLREVADLPDLSGTKYRLLRRLGRGGMGSVYLVEDRELGREVALKVLADPDPGGDSAARLMEEARHLARLEHPNIVPVHDVGRLADGRVFYVMTYVRGTRLDAWRREGPSRPVVLRQFQKVCDAVGFAHARGVVHRDLKPENIMVGPFGEALVLDWGLARTRGASGGDRFGPLAGTPAYMSPEQARGETEEIDESTDVYALGGILYYLLAGRPPYNTATPAATLREVLESHPRPLRQIDPEIPKALEAICAKAMAREAAKRYPRPGDLSEDLDRFLDRLPVRAHRESTLERFGRVFDRNRVLIYLLLAYLVMRAAVVLVTGR